MQNINEATIEAIRKTASAWSISHKFGALPIALLTRDLQAKWLATAHITAKKVGVGGTRLRFKRMAFYCLIFGREIRTTLDLTRGEIYAFRQAVEAFPEDVEAVVESINEEYA